MVGLEAIESYYPSKKVYIPDLKNYLNINDFQIKLFNRFHGLEEIRLDFDQKLIDLLTIPLEKLLNKVNINDIKFILYAHTIQTVTPYPINIIEKIKKLYHLEHAVSFSVIQHNCSSAITALDIARFLLQNEKEKVLLITGEKAFTPLAQIIPNTSIMGEASTASIISKNSNDNKILAVERKILGKFSEGINLEGKLLKEFEKLYVPTLVDTISSAVKKAGLTMQDIKIILPHNVNKSSWYKVADQMKIDRNMIYLSNIPKLGHCFCSDPFLNYIDAIKEGLIKKGDYFLLASVGLGATFSAAVLQH